MTSLSKRKKIYIILEAVQISPQEILEDIIGDEYHCMLNYCYIKLMGLKRDSDELNQVYRSAKQIIKADKGKK